MTLTAIERICKLHLLIGQLNAFKDEQLEGGAGRDTYRASYNFTIHLVK